MLPGFAVVYVSEKINSSLTLGTGHKLRLHFSDGSGSVGTIFIVRKDIDIENGNFPLLYVRKENVLTYGG